MADFDSSQFGNGLAGIFQGLFGNSDAPYKAYGKEYEKYANQGQATQQPFYNAGVSAIPDYQNWAKSMSNPSDFINHLMNNYQESPWAKFQQQQGQRTANNAASASGLLGSTPFSQASQDYARNISSEDMNQWLQNVLGINTQYGAAQGNLMTGGQNSANQLTQLFQQLAENMGAAKYGQKQGQNQDRGSLFGGIGNLFSSGLFG